MTGPNVSFLMVPSAGGPGFNLSHIDLWSFESPDCESVSVYGPG